MSAVATKLEPMPSMWAFRFDGRDLRIIDRQGNPWFVAKDVAAALGYRDTDASVRRHCRSLQFLKPDEASGLDVPSRGLVIIPAADVYRLIMRSSLTSAERFEEWVVGEVLPQIRRAGSYGLVTDPMQALNDPATMRTLLLTYTEKVIALEAANAEMMPKAEALARIAESDGSFCITDAAKTMQVQPNALFKFLRSHGWIYTRVSSSQEVAYQSDRQHEAPAHPEGHNMILKLELGHERRDLPWRADDAKSRRQSVRAAHLARCQHSFSRLRPALSAGVHRQALRPAWRGADAA